MAPEPHFVSSPRLTGRANELARLRHALDHPGALVLIEGEAGVGKTRLITEFFTGRAPTIRSRRLVGGCPPIRPSFTLGPLVDAVREMDADIGSLGLSDLAGALRPLFPEWASRLPPDPPPAVDASIARHRLYAAMEELLRRLAITVVVIEDAHWADESTVEFLLLSTSRRPRSWSAVVTYRPEDLREDSAIRRLSRSATGDHGLQLLLEALDPDQTRQVIESMLGDEISAELARFVFAGTEGLPLAVEEVVRALHDRAQLILSEGEWVRQDGSSLEVPTAVRDLVHDRFGRLDVHAQVVLRAAAVAAAPVDESLLAAIADLPRPQARAGIAEALSCQLLREDGSGALAFRHLLFGQAISDVTSALERRRLHHRAARALERLRPVPLARVARHYRESGDVANWCRYGEQAAALALRAGDESTADALLLELICHPDMPPPDVARLSRELRFAGSDGSTDYPALLQALRAAAASADISPSVRGELRCRLGNALMMVYDYDEGLREIEAAIPDLGHDHALAAWAMTLLGCPFGSRERVSTNLRWLRRADALGGPAPAKVASLRMLALLMLGRPEGWQQAAAVPLVATDPETRLRVARNNLNVGHAAIFWGRYPDARVRLEAAEQLATRHCLHRTELAARLTMVHLDYLCGEWSDLGERAERLATDPEAARGAALEASLVRALLDLARGNRDSAVGRARQVADAARTHGQEDLWLGAVACLATAALDDGGPDAAAVVLADPVQMVIDREMWLWATEIAPEWVRALVALDRAKAAERFIDSFAAGLGSLDAPAPQAALLGCRAELSSRHPDEARRRLADAAAAWAALPRPYEALRCRARAAELRLSTGDEAAALAELSDTALALWRLGATDLADRLARLVRRGGIRLHRPGAGRPSYGEELSPREQQVAALVAAGRTDHEIAGELYLSPRTVESHVAAARRKLAAPSRAALAARVVDAGLITAEN